MELIIDTIICDRSDEPIRLPKLDLSRLGEVATFREGRRLELHLPATATNDRLFGFARDPETADCFNATSHHGQLLDSGVVLIEGRVVLLAASDEGYHIRLVEGSAGWATQAALRMLHALQIDYAETLTPTMIVRSWSDSSPVKFFPIHRDDYEQTPSGSDLLPQERILTVDDYFPFLHIATLVEQIFHDAGYTIESRFLRSEFFQKLFLSGAYSSRDTTAAQNRMGFLARRLQAVTAEADHMGRVYADPAALYSTVGNLVESASPLAVDEVGAVLQELYNNGHCFTMEEGRILFRPLGEVYVGFEYLLRYTTDHRIRSRTELIGFDRLYIPGCGLITAHLTNRYPDCRHSLRNNHSYRALVFDHEAGNQYRIQLTVNGVNSVVWTEFSSRSVLITSPATGSLSNLKLQLLGERGWVDTTLDWALYEGYVDEVGTTQVEMRLHSAAEVVTPENPKYFDTIFFGGAEPGMQLTLDRTCTLKPLFRSTPGYGSALDFATVAQHSIRQIELLEALAHLFNLRFWSDEERKVVYMEPAELFYKTDHEVDWRERVDFTDPIRLIDLTPELHEQQTWCYREGDGAVVRFEQQEDGPFGAWSFSCNRAAALQGEAIKRNPLFSPSINSAGHYRNAPSARLLQVGDRDTTEGDGTNFSMRIVSYRGVKSLPEGEMWGYPLHRAEYPLIAFHLPPQGEESGFTLCFEDRDGVKGLHRYYDATLREKMEGGLAEVTLDLAPHELEQLLHVASEGPSLGAHYRLRSSCGEFRGTLHTIERGVAGVGPIRCTFSRSDR